MSYNHHQKKYSELQLKQIIADLRSQLAALFEKEGEWEEENRRLKEQMALLEKTFGEEQRKSEEKWVAEKRDLVEQLNQQKQENRQLIERAGASAKEAEKIKLKMREEERRLIEEYEAQSQSLIDEMRKKHEAELKEFKEEIRSLKIHNESLQKQEKQWVETLRQAKLEWEQEKEQLLKAGNEAVKEREKEIMELSQTVQDLKDKASERDSGDGERNAPNESWFVRNLKEQKALAVNGKGDSFLLTAEKPKRRRDPSFLDWN